MDFGVLGSLKVRHADGDVTIGSQRQRRLLAALLVHAGSVVSNDRLMAAVWGVDQPAAMVGTLHTYVSRLRSLLRSASDEVLITRPPGYLLRIRPEQTDAGRFERLLDEARAATSADPQAALSRLDEALALWRGPAYAEFADDEFARSEAVRLAESRLAAVEERFDTMLTLGRHNDVPGAIEAYTAEHPLRERPRAQLMLALYRGGRHAEALAVFREFRRRLYDELGVEPSASLRTLETAILRQGPELDWTPPATAAGTSTTAEPVPVPRRSHGVLPHEASSLVGREDDVAAVAAALTEYRLVTLTGVGGIGKTRLALQTAGRVTENHPDGVFWCELAPVHDGSSVAHALAAAVGARQQPGWDIEESLIAFLGAKRLLLAIDNCEHVLADAARLVGEVVRRCPNVTLLATSRLSLGVTGELIRPTVPLTVPAPGSGTAAADAPAVRLFVDRARAVRPDLVLDDDNLAHIAELCRQLDGLPLGIELAAARVRSVNPADLAARGGDRFGLLTTTRAGVAPRHRTLRAVVDWSYALLSPAEQRLFVRLSVFSGGFTLDAAEHVCGEPALLDMVATLVDNSLVVAGSTAGQVRFTMLETLRAYGGDLLTRRGETARTHDAHARYYAELAGQAGQGLRGRQEGYWTAVLDADADNLRAAHRWAVEQKDTDVALRLSAGLYHYSLYQFHDEVVSWGEKALTLPRAEEHPLYFVVCGAVGEGLTVRGELSRASALAEQAMASADPATAARLPLLKVMAVVALYEGRLDDCVTWAETQCHLARTHHELWYEAEALSLQSMARTYAGDPETGLALADHCLRLVRAGGNPSQLAWGQYLQGEALAQSDPEQAEQCYERAIAMAGAVNSNVAENVARVGLAALLMRTGRPAEALRAFASSVRRWHELQVWHHQWTTLRNLVQLLVRLGAHEEAATLLGGLGAADTDAFGSDADGMSEAGDVLRDSLGAERFAAATRRGTTMSTDATVTFALSAVDTVLTPRDQEHAGLGQ